jgi:hypothetical protein
VLVLWDTIQSWWRLKPMVPKQRVTDKRRVMTMGALTSQKLRHSWCNNRLQNQWRHWLLKKAITARCVQTDGSVHVLASRFSNGHFNIIVQACRSIMWAAGVTCWASSRGWNQYVAFHPLVVTVNREESVQWRAGRSCLQGRTVIHYTIMWLRGVLSSRA